MNFMNKWWPSILAVSGALAGIFAEPIKAAISAHPSVVAVLAAVLGVLSHLLPSPVVQTNK